MPVKTVGSANVAYLQIIDENGKADEQLDPKLPNERLVELYRLLVLSRVFDQKSMSLQRQGRTYTYGPVEGEEACQVGSAVTLQKSDWMFVTYRESAASITRGADLTKLLLYTMGSEESNRTEKGDNNFPPAIPVGSQLTHAIGVALGMKFRKDASVALVYFGDGATSQGEALEALNFAGVYKLPVVFVCQNNYYAISVPLKKQTASETLAQKAHAFGFEGLQVDGNDVLAVYAATRAAVEKARQGGGPTFLELLTYRFGPHTTSDDPSRYRSKEEEQVMRAKDPLPRFEKYLRSKSLIDDAKITAIKDACIAQVEKAVEGAEAAGAPPADDMFKYTYETLPPFLQEEWEEFTREQAERKTSGGE